ncbi:hypothetical protein [Rhizobium sp. RCC_161_2]|uniref:hypothetical protein n=1 Tax=Rhizobium sp. RCC_161_2 TaxID=3239219 RepID=UPI0035251BC0
MEIYRRYRHGAAPPGSIIAKFYHSGDQIRGFIRKAAPAGEEMEPDDAFRATRKKMVGELARPIYVELSQGVQWNSA